MRGSSAWQRVENEKEEEEEGRDKVNAARINLPHAVCKTYLRMRCATGNVQRCTDTPIRTVDICGGHFNTPPLRRLFFWCKWTMGRSFFLAFWWIDAEVVVASEVNRGPRIHNCAGSEQCGCDVKTTQQ